MSYDDPKPATATSDLKLKAGGTPVYKRVLDLFEAEGIKTVQLLNTGRRWQIAAVAWEDLA